MRSHVLALCLTLSFAGLSHAPRAFAADTAAAQALFDQGKALMAEGKAAEACPKFAESQRLDPGVGTELNLAACYEAAGQLASAWTTFLEAESAAHAAANADAERVAHERAQALAPKLAKVVINVKAADTPGLELFRDGVAVGRAQWGSPIPADPGKHVIEAKAPGHAPFRTEATLTNPGEVVNVDVPALTPAAAAPTPTEAPASTAAPAPASDSGGGGLGTQHYLAIGAGVVGVAGVVVGSVFGLKSMSKRDAAESHCAGGDCRDATGVSLRDEARSAGNLSTIGFVVGAVGLAGGAVLWFTASPSSDGHESAVRIGPSSLTLVHRF